MSTTQRRKLRSFVAWCVSESVCMRMRAEGKGPTHARRGCSEGPEWGVLSAERSAEDKKKGGGECRERVRFGETFDYSAASGCVSRVESVFWVINPIHTHTHTHTYM